MMNVASPCTEDSVIEQELNAKGKTAAPRVTKSDIEANIASEHYMNPYDEFEDRYVKDEHPPEALKRITICILVLRNGFTVIGTSTCVSLENFDVTVGWKLAREDAVRQIWPLMGYELRQNLVERSYVSRNPPEAA